MLKSHEKEKSAVMAITDEESQLFADESLAATNAVESDLNKLTVLIEAGKIDKEMQLLLEFRDCWKDFRKIDELLLGFAVQNTNLKAANLSYTKGADAIRRFENSLSELIEISDKTDKKDSGISEDIGIIKFKVISNDAKIAKLGFKAVRAGLDIYSLESPHINASDDKQMDNIELLIKDYQNQVKTYIDLLGDIADIGVKQPQYKICLEKASTAFSKFMAVNAEVVRLSRLNSNIRSVELSLGVKRKVAVRCDDILSLLQETVQSRILKSIK